MIFENTKCTLWKLWKIVGMGNVKEIRRVRREFLNFVGNARKHFIVRGDIKEMIGNSINVCVAFISCSIVIFDWRLNFVATLRLDQPGSAKILFNLLNQFNLPSVRVEIVLYLLPSWFCHFCESTAKVVPTRVHGCLDFSPNKLWFYTILIQYIVGVERFFISLKERV